MQEKKKYFLLPVKDLVVFPKSITSILVGRKKSISAVEESLKEDKLTAGEIAQKFNLTNATMSYHLKELKKADLILETKYKNYRYYELNISVFEEVLIWIKSLGGK